MHLYIALYKTGNLGAYHWALVPTKEVLDPIASLAVPAFQISNADEGARWTLAHRTDANLAQSNRLACCIHLPIIDIELKQLYAFVAEQPAEQGYTPLLQTHQRWTCAQWCIRILSQLSEGGLLDVELGTAALGAHFYRKICALGMLGERLPKSGGIIIIDHDHDIRY
ncbi:hypothetical protein ARMSODRAFT_1018036 [Armillaria solidipes]|uniref:Uncharacterized protein n=1 Tax=Armillaria solidipes TaxID=1076256 RepID=A0A2H3C5C8_9AGAR|nr:hypothetical protein ARMSODRAFT_1018036 [Armillaria solidipes]